MSRYIAGLGAWLLISPLLLVGAAKPLPQKSPPRWFWGCWVVTKTLPTAGVSGLSEKQVDAIIGTRIVFTPTRARSGHTVIDSPKYSVKILSAKDFFKLGYFPLSQIGIREQQVTVVHVHLPDRMSDMDFPGNWVFLRKKDIVIDVENQSFLAVRARPGDPACRCEFPKAK